MLTFGDLLSCRFHDVKEGKRHFLSENLKKAGTYHEWTRDIKNIKKYALHTSDCWVILCSHKYKK